MVKIRVADYIADFIFKKGVKNVFLLPGGGAMFLVDAMGAHKGIEVIPCHHEQSCGIAAESYSRITENFGVAVVTTGPGSTNIITTVAGAWIESVPLMVISGQVKRADMIRDKKIRQSGVQEVNIIDMVKNITKYAVTIEEPNGIYYHLEKAYFEMMNGRKGPVWIDVPLDVQAGLIDNGELIIENGKNFEKRKIDDDKLEEKLSIINYQLSIAKRPLILAGHGIRLSGGAKIFRKLVEKLKIPVVVTWNAMDLIEHNSRYFIGKIGVVAPRAGNFAIQNCDLLISIGSRLDNILTAYNIKNFAKNAKKFIIDIDVNELKRMELENADKINADAKYFIEAFLKFISKYKFYEKKEWLKICQNWKNKFNIKNEIDFSGERISHYEFSIVLSEELKENTIIATGSSGMGIEAFYTSFKVKKGQRVFLTSGLGAMGYGVPSAIGACIANSKKKIIAVESDGSLQLNIQELATITGNNLPVCLFIMDNEGYASIRNSQRAHFNRFVATGAESGLFFPDLAKIFKAYGFKTIVIKNRKYLRKGIRKALSIDGAVACIVKTKKEEPLIPKCSAIIKEDGSIISMPLEDMSPLLSLEELKSNMVSNLSEQSLLVRDETFMATCCHK